MATIIASHKTFFTPGMCSAFKVMLWVSSVSTSGRMICIIVLCLMVCLLMISTTARLSQWKTIWAFVNLHL